jgi:hypothetical protein
MRPLLNFLIPDMVDAAGASKFHVDMPQKPQKRWLRRLKWPGIILAGLLVLIYGILPLIMTPMLRSRDRSRFPRSSMRILQMVGLITALTRGQ